MWYLRSNKPGIIEVSIHRWGDLRSAYCFKLRLEALKVSMRIVYSETQIWERTVKPIHDFSTHKSIYIYKSYSGDLLLLVTGLGSPLAFG